VVPVNTTRFAPGFRRGAVAPRCARRIDLVAFFLLQAALVKAVEDIPRADGALLQAPRSEGAGRTAGCRAASGDSGV